MTKLNGSVERLAEALQDVFGQLATKEDLQSLKQDLQESEERLIDRIDRAVEDIVAERGRKVMGD